jgi:hypothetical protein
MLRHAKVTFPRTVRYTRLFTVLIIESVLAGLVLLDKKMDTPIWDDFLYKLVQSASTPPIVTALLSAIIIGLVFHTIITFVFHQVKEDDIEYKHKIRNAISLMVGYAVCWIILGYVLFFIFVEFEEEEDIMNNWIWISMLIFAFETIVMSTIRVSIKWCILKLRCTPPFMKTYLEEV